MLVGVLMYADVCGAAGAELRDGDFHGEMEAKAKMNW